MGRKGGFGKLYKMRAVFVIWQYVKAVRVKSRINNLLTLTLCAMAQDPPSCFLAAGIILTSSSANNIRYTSNNAREAAAAGFILLSIVNVGEPIAARMAMLISSQIVWIVSLEDGYLQTFPQKTGTSPHSCVVTDGGYRWYGRYILCLQLVDYEG
jgi:hypothetical protein